MSETKFFSIEDFESGAFVSPLESVRSFSDEQVRGEWCEVLTILEAAGANNIVIDLGRLSFFGSAMLEWIVLVGKYVKTREGRLVLCNGQPLTLEVLKIAKFDTLYPIVGTREDAVKSLE